MLPERMLPEEKPSERSPSKRKSFKRKLFREQRDRKQRPPLRGKSGFPLQESLFRNPFSGIPSSEVLPQRFDRPETNAGETATLISFVLHSICPSFNQSVSAMPGKWMNPVIGLLAGFLTYMLVSGILVSDIPVSGNRLGVPDSAMGSAMGVALRS